MAKILTNAEQQERVHRMAATLLEIARQKPEKTYLLFYDLNEQTGKYKELEAKLKEISAVEVLESTYLFRSRFQTAQQAWAIFKPFIDKSKERAIIMEISDNMYDSDSDK